jgi:hypothetical protein
MTTKKFAQPDLRPPSLPTLSPASDVLSSSFPLPPDPYVIYAKFAPESQSLESLEIARRTVLGKNEKKPLLESLLPFVHVAPAGSSCLYIFGIAGRDAVDERRQVLSGLAFEGLKGELYSSVVQS